MNPDSWPAPAKLNLFLHILGRRPDGYHQLQTVFQLLEFGDELTIRADDKDRINLEQDYDGIDLENDLVLRAATLLKAKTETRKGAVISVNKRIPIGGGLGGGSSDAATTLVVLNRLWNTGLSLYQLSDLGLQLGADVPVFIQGHSSWAEGVGERPQPVELPDNWFLVIYPDCPVNTATVFNQPELTRNSTPITIRDFLGGAGHNDCEKVVYDYYPEVAAAAKWLDGWTKARLTGTGSCIFGRFGSEQEASTVLAQLPHAWQGFVSRGCNMSPLHQKLARSAG